MRQLGRCQAEQDEDQPEPQQQIAAQRRAPLFAGTGQRAQQQRGIGQHCDQQHRHVIPPAAAMPVQRLLQAVQIVAQEKALQKTIALAQELQQIPGRSDDQEQHPGAALGEQAQPDAPLATAGAVQQTDSGGNHHRHRSLSQEAQAHRQRCRIQPDALPFAQIQV